MTKEELIKLSRENLRKSKQGSLCECYDEAFIKGYELSKKCIAELEKKLKNKCVDTNCPILSINKQNMKRIADLEKENAELKDDNKVMADNYSKMEQKFYDNLTNAKELLKQWLQTSKNNSCDNINIVADTEQFLSEVEK